MSVYPNQEILEISVECDTEAAEAVSELFNRYNGGDYDEDSAVGEASGGGAVVESIGFDDWGKPIDGEFRMWVKTYVKPGVRGDSDSAPDRRRAVAPEPALPHP